mmetsp:Transcript_43332/g.85842  ORF Transcript_43332/g.85842 Transcript_43332/m.85842 type:complete len:347 (+) Transcript_43332:94-1134(+)
MVLPQMPVRTSDLPSNLHGTALVASRTSSRELRTKPDVFPSTPSDDFPGRPMGERAQPTEYREPGFFQHLLWGFNCRRSCSNSAGPYGYGGASFKDAKPSGYTRLGTTIPEENMNQQHTVLHETRGWCGGPGGICFEAEQVQKEVNWSFVGPGKGTWQVVSDYSFVGKGMGGWDVVMTKGFYGWKPKWACIGLLAGLTAAAAVGIWEWQHLLSQHLPSARGSRQSLPVDSSESEMFNCTKDRHTWTEDWSLDKQRYCCKKYGRACPRSKYNCSTDADNWKRAWSAKKKAWCCERSPDSCQLPPSQRKWMSAVPGRQLVGQKRFHTTSEVQREWWCKMRGFGCPHKV